MLATNESQATENARPASPARDNDRKTLEEKEPAQNRQGRVSETATVDNAGAADDEEERDESPGPPDTDLRRRLAFVRRRIFELQDDAEGCGCEYAIGYDSDGEIRHLQIDCAYTKYEEYCDERDRLKRAIRHERP